VSGDLAVAPARGIGHRTDEPMTDPPDRRDPLHGVTLAMMLERLVDTLGWDAMGRAIDIRCFTHEPSIASSLKFLRRTPWAREKVETLYLNVFAGSPERLRSPRR
jgi:uncharacterized protein (DUF2132 family)